MPSSGEPIYGDAGDYKNQPPDLPLDGDQIGGWGYLVGVSYASFLELLNITPALVGQLGLDGAGFTYLRIVTMMSPQYAYLAILNVYAVSHNLTDWALAQRLLNLVSRAGSLTSTDPVWIGGQLGGFPPVTPPPIPPPQPTPPPVTPIPPPQPGGPYPIAPPIAPPTQYPGPNDDWDEVTYLKVQMDNALGNILQALQSGGGSDGGSGLSADCCTALVTALGAINQTLTTIQALIPTTSGTAPTPVDLSGVITALTAVVSALAAMAAPLAGISSMPVIAGSLATIAEELAAPPQPTDLAHLNAAADQAVNDQTAAQLQMDTLFAGLQADYSTFVGNQ